MFASRVHSRVLTGCFLRQEVGGEVQRHTIRVYEGGTGACCVPWLPLSELLDITKTCTSEIYPAMVQVLKSQEAAKTRASEQTLKNVATTIHICEFFFSLGRIRVLTISSCD